MHRRNLLANNSYHYDSDASDYEWERQIKYIWIQVDEAFAEAYIEDHAEVEEEEEDQESSLEEEFGKPVSVARRLIGLVT